MHNVASTIKGHYHKIQVVQKGTLQLLDEWIRKSWRTQDWRPWVKGMDAFRKLRKLRQKPAHKVDEDVFDQQYFRDQRKLIMDVYGGVRTIRLMFSNHPRVKMEKIEVPDWLFEGRIWSM